MRNFWIGCLWLVMCGLAMAAERPNVVFLLVDDLRWNALGCMGDDIVRSPNIDAMARDGVIFKNAFVTTSICSVSRASIMSGQWMRRHGINDFVTGFSDGQWAGTYPKLLKGDGYWMGVVGKLGVGNAQAMAAREGDFDVWKAQPGQGGKWFIDPNDPGQKHATVKYGDEALKFLREVKQDAPFCLAVNFNAVHARDKQPREFQPDLRDEELYKDVEIPLPPTATEEAFEKLPEFVKTSEGRTRWKWRFDEPKKAQGILKDYYRLITGVDREVGRIREVLKERGLADNTVIIFASDNGFALGDRGLADKWFMWEEDIRVVSIVYDPRMREEWRGRVVEAMVLNVDIAPTILDLAGVEVPSVMQGRSLMPWLRGETPADWRTEFFYEHHAVPDRIPQVEGVRTEKWKYIRWIVSDPLVEELYDLEVDPLEQNNLVKDEKYAQVLEELRGKWRGYGTSLQ